MLSGKLLAAAFVASLAAGPALAQQSTNVRGTIAAFDGKTISIKSNAGQDVSIAMPDNVNVSITRPFTLADAKPGMMLGVTTIQKDGQTIAIDVRPIPATAPTGLSPYDLQPQSTMTNGSLEAAVASTGAQELTLNLKGSMVKVLVPPGTPMSRAAPGSRDDLKPGETIYVAARRDDAGSLTAVRVQVSKDGVKPTQ